MPRRSLRLVFILLCAAIPIAAAQTQTVANANGDGGSVVEVITTDINGLPVTNILQTIPPGAAQTSTAPAAAAATLPAAQAQTTTTTPGNLGPVAVPPPTVPVGEGLTTYEYTTTDALGETQVIHDTFTPTYNTPSPQSSPAAGTVLSPSDYSALIGTHTAGGPTSGDLSWRTTPMVGIAMALVGGAVVGTLAIL